MMMSLAAVDQKDILQTAAIELGRHEAVLEKDIWVKRDRSSTDERSSF